MTHLQLAIKDPTAGILRTTPTPVSLARGLIGQRFTETKGHSREIQRKAGELCHDILPKVPVQLVEACTHAPRKDGHILQSHYLVADIEIQARLQVDVARYHPPGARTLIGTPLPAPNVCAKPVEVAYREAGP